MKAFSTHTELLGAHTVDILHSSVGIGGYCQKVLCLPRHRIDLYIWISFADNNEEPGRRIFVFWEKVRQCVVLHIHFFSFSSLSPRIIISLQGCISIGR